MTEKDRFIDMLRNAGVPYHEAKGKSVIVEGTEFVFRPSGMLEAAYYRDED